MKIYNYFLLGALCTLLLLSNQNTIQAQSISSDINIDDVVLKSYVGRYNYGQGAVLIVSLDGKQLNGQLTGQPKFPIYPISTNEFAWKVVEAKVKFVTDDKGIVTHAIHYQNGTQFEAKRLNDETPVTVNPAIFDKYIGKYDIGENNLIVVTKDADKLMAQGPNLPTYQLLPSSETDYFVREINAKLSFKVNQEGKAASITIYFDGIERTANRVVE